MRVLKGLLKIFKGKLQGINSSHPDYTIEYGHSRKNLERVLAIFSCFFMMINGNLSANPLWFQQTDKYNISYIKLMRAVSGLRILTRVVVKCG